MLSIRWETLMVVALIALMVGYLVVQATLRINGVRLLEALRLSRFDYGDEPQFYDIVPARESTLVGDQPSLRRPAASASTGHDARAHAHRRRRWGTHAARITPVRRHIS
jgi:hypothetical protein